MPKKSFDSLPFPPLVTLDRDEPICIRDLEPILRSRTEGVTLCVRSGEVEGAENNRGGYFFHIAPTVDIQGEYYLTDFEKIPVKRLNGSVIHLETRELCEFINHCTGMQFSEEYMFLSQSEINFRSDGDEDD